MTAKHRWSLFGTGSFVLSRIYEIIFNVRIITYNFRSFYVNIYIFWMEWQFYLKTQCNNDIKGIITFLGAFFMTLMISWTIARHYFAVDNQVFWNISMISTRVLMYLYKIRRNQHTRIGPNTFTVCYKSFYGVLFYVCLKTYS